MGYKLDDNSYLFCRTCQEETRHSQASRSTMGCHECGRRINVSEIVATYSADEYSNPPEILLPLRSRAYIRQPHVED